MVSRATTMRHAAATAALEQAFRDIRAEFDVREAFPADVVRAAERAVTDATLPARDDTVVPFVTIDPPGSMDLDQAVHIERGGDGYRVRYAIADVTTFVAPGGVIDDEVRLRGQTIYCPDVRVPLHPTVMSEGAASLLPGEDRPAYVWDIVLDADGTRTAADVYRTMVRSRQRYTYDEVQAHVDASHDGPDTLTLLRDVGRARIERESARGGASLPMPEQEVYVDADGRYQLRFRPQVEAELWNAQISLLTGIAAAEIMLAGRVGILRTMPSADPRDVARFRRAVGALGVPWPGELPYGDFLRTLDRHDPRHLAVVHDATSLFRGAAYRAFDGEPPDHVEQAAIAAPYSHVTAPLRRLVDRFALVVCDALTSGDDVPAWARDALAELPKVMARTDATARAVERACTDATEAAVLAHRVGERFDAVVVDEARDGALVVQVIDPAVTALADGSAGLGTAVTIELTTADVASHTVRFALG
jgi:exoribonuclease R